MASVTQIRDRAFFKCLGGHFWKLPFFHCERNTMPDFLLNLLSVSEAV